MRSIASYYKVGPETECDFVKALGTTKTSGTRPENMVKGAKAFGLKTKFEEHWTIAKLKRTLDEEKPVICNIQAYGTPKDYEKRLSGHYVIAIGYDDKKIYFEDPSMKGNRGFLSYQEFDERWHDQSSKGEHTDHLGIVVWKEKGDNDAHYLLRSKKIK